ncbi:hypothetical protein [Absidia glauca]|uniref:DNA mismatch repair proteins mutS family domain-containing protein n=1 Tax=Absidia glauca TaxID=4829 RepID=A0A163MED2_ABSGL|nr:hypothetical protein [Absidia glauca]
MSNTYDKHGDIAENDEATMVLLVLYWKSSQLGCVYYLHQFRELYFIMDVKNMDLKDIVLELLHQIQPTHVILCKSNELELTAIIKNYDPDIKIESTNAKSFTYQKGRQELINWYIEITPNTSTASTSLQQQQHYPTAASAHSSLGGQSTPMHPQDRLRNGSPSPSSSSSSLSSLPPSYQHHRYISDDNITKQALFNLSSMVPMDSFTTITCLAPLFDAFKEGLFGPEMIGIKPMTLQTISLPDTMHVPIDVIRSLEIFQPRLHPSTHQKKGKEITSLYHLLNYTVSPGGTHLLKQWILRPSLNLTIINERQKSVAIFTAMDQRKGSFIKKLASYLKHVKNMARILGRIYEHRAKVSEWHQLLQFIYYVIKIDNLLRLLTTPVDSPIVEKFMNLVDVELLTRIGKYINDNITFEESQLEGRLTIKKGIDRDLDLLRSKYEALDNYLLQVAHEISAPLPVDIGHLLNVVYFPQLGYLLTLPSTAHDYFAQNAFLYDGCTLQFTTQENCYYKIDRMRDMDEEIGDLHGMIIDKQIELIQEISEQILQHRQLILTTTQTLAEMDCMAAIHNHYIRPQMTDDDDQHELTIIQGRHPLQELVMDTFIANDTFLASGMTLATTQSAQSPSHFVPPKPRYPTPSASSSDRLGLLRHTDAKNILLLTGANYSGKSIYLKQIGLIVYMAHLGSFVPAERAVISVVDKLFTSIQTAEMPGKGVGASFGSWCASLGGIPGEVLERATTLYQQLSQEMPYEEPTLTQQEARRYEDLDGLLARFLNLQDFDNDEDAGELQSIIDSVASLF